MLTGWSSGFVGIEGSDAPLKHPPSGCVNGTPIRKSSRSQAFFQVLDMSNRIFAGRWKERRLFDQGAVGTISELPTGLTDARGETFPVPENLPVRLVLAIAEQALDFRVERYRFLSAHYNASRRPFIMLADGCGLLRARQDLPHRVFHGLRSTKLLKTTRRNGLGRLFHAFGTGLCNLQRQVESSPDCIMASGLNRDRATAGRFGEV